LLPDGSIYAHNAQLDFTANQVDERTASVQSRAVVNNPDLTLSPGQFLRVRVPMAQYRQVIQIPVAALVQNSNGSFVYVVNEQQQAELRAIRLGPVIGERQVVLEGLQAGERVVSNGQVSLAPGATVQVTQTDPAPSAGESR
jgi:membrane fusion protein (multidrug efflux system)